MDEKEIKVGEKYLLPVTVTEISSNGWIEVKTFGDYGYRLAPLEIKTLLQNGTKNTETAPKYDPNRIFRKGDKVRLVRCNGRNPFDSFNGIEYPPDETIYTVDGDEYDNGKVELYSMDSCDVFGLHHSNLELVTPVEELEPYFISEGAGIIELYKGTTDEVVKAWFYDTVKDGVEALAAAETERDRLNAEWRKEQNND